MSWYGKHPMISADAVKAARNGKYCRFCIYRGRALGAEFLTKQCSRCSGSKEIAPHPGKTWVQGTFYRKWTNPEHGRFLRWWWNYQ